MSGVNRARPPPLTRRPASASYPDGVSRSRSPLPFAEARTLAQTRGWSSREEYRLHYAAVPGLPLHPDRVYAGAWQGWGDFLGVTVLPYAQAASLAREQGFTTRQAYLSGYAAVPGLPGWPPKAYPTEWEGWAAFLGRGKRVTFLPYAEAVAAVRERGWSTRNGYREQYREVPGLPSEPDAVYADEWTGWTAFLAPAPSAFLPYEEARAATQAQGWTTEAAYRTEYRAVPGLPSNPNAVYAEWTTWGDFLGTGRTRRKDVPVKEAAPVRVWAPYGELRARVQAAGVLSAREYAVWQASQPDAPFMPSGVYSEWEGWPTFLGKTEGKTRYLSYAQAQVAVRSAGITSAREYAAGAYKRVPGLPSSPYKTYEEWAGWKAFLSGAGKKPAP